MVNGRNYITIHLMRFIPINASIHAIANIPSNAGVSLVSLVVFSLLDCSCVGDVVSVDV
jgi:hypothetical protein